MPYPRLTSVLNNCAVHALTPEIRTQVSEYARDADYDNEHNREYGRLKDVFAEFYGFDVARFTWEAFSNTLNFYNAFDIQLVLGPVLRLYMKGSMTANVLAENSLIPTLAELEEPPVSVEDYINSYTETSATRQGRYRNIAPDELSQYIANPLGLKIRYYSQEEAVRDQEGAVRDDEIENPIAVVDIYHFGAAEDVDGHWERVEDVTREDCIDYQQQPNTKLTCLLPLLGQGQAMTLPGIKLLRQHVTLVAPGHDDEANINLTSTQISKYISAVNVVPKTLAIRLLGDPTQETGAFIDSAPIAARVPAMQIYENYIRTLSRCKPQVTMEERGIIDQLLSGLTPQQTKALTEIAFFNSLGDRARRQVAATMGYLQTMAVDFSHVDGEQIDEHARGLIYGLDERVRALEEDLRILAKSLRDFPQITVALQRKAAEVGQAALQAKRELLLTEINFGEYLEQFEMQAIEMEENRATNPGLNEAAQAAGAFVTAITNARTNFIQTKNKPIEESKRILKEACQAAVDAARTHLADNPGWIMLVARFLNDLVSSVIVRVTGNRWTMFTPTPAEKIAEFEREVVNSPSLSAPGG